jgi:hypothetical protein
MYKYTSNGNFTYFQNMPQQSTNTRTNTDTSRDLQFCIASLIITGKTMTQVTDMIDRKTSQMVCQLHGVSVTWRVSYNLHAFQPDLICDEREPFVLLKQSHITHS